ncbi:MAG: phosphate ABC transporter permease PstA [Gammaproteobacteria bacterium]|nr:phosphate ABC transporter permease PstA [Gammaproteobacteria bacterium]MCP5200612.1 phosphate ABC transporter permease PstA [Gammaproteobacteria bacterium]
MDNADRRPDVRDWVASGQPWIWLTAGTVSMSLIMVVGLLALITLRGMGHFWPAGVVELSLRDGSLMLGEYADHETVTAARVRGLGIEVPAEREFVDRFLLKVGNRDVTGADFRWVNDIDIVATRYPTAAFVAEREEWGNFYGFVDGIREGETQLDEGVDLWAEIDARLARKQDLAARIAAIEDDAMDSVNYALERLRLRERRLELDGVPAGDEAHARIAAERAELDQRYQDLSAELAALHHDIERDVLLVHTVDGEARELPFAKLVRVFRPNGMSWLAKLGHYFDKAGEFVADDPREANTEGGVFPAIFGTVLMVLLMSVFVTPFGVIAAIYLREYAQQGTMTRIIRIAVNNLAGVPSVVYGVFGLGFFVYFLGGSIDRLFFPEALPAPTFGTPGLLWSSVTLALLTVPVVIVATEEGLSRIPRSIREGSLALGATKAETLWRTVLPMATPAMMTGLILAVARAAGEVAPLMMVGVVKLAPSLPLDGNFPFLHLDRKFMHLGFHIYDVGFQSPNVEAARPLVYATALLLVIIIVALNLAAITIRNRLREKYNAAET